MASNKKILEFVK